MQRQLGLYDPNEDAVSASGCNCFQLFCGKCRQFDDMEPRLLLKKHEGGSHQKQYREETWLLKSSKKVREVTELLAGPKWKTFVRKLSARVKTKKNQKNGNQFQYDPISYALNFDSGAHNEDNGFAPCFSSRFAAPFVDQKLLSL